MDTSDWTNHHKSAQGLPDFKYYIFPGGQEPDIEMNGNAFANGSLSPGIIHLPDQNLHSDYPDSKSSKSISCF